MMYDACIDCGETKTGRHRRSPRCKKHGYAFSALKHAGNTNGAGNTDKPLSSTHRQKISLGHGGDGDIMNRKYPGLGSWTRLVKERDGHKCAECDFQGAKGDGFMDAHHVIPKATYPELATVLFNGVTLCRPCHKQIHRENIEE